MSIKSSLPLELSRIERFVVISIKGEQLAEIEVVSPHYWGEPDTWTAETIIRLAALQGVDTYALYQALEKIPRPIDLGRGRSVLAYVPVRFGSWETSDGIAIVRDRGGVIWGFWCHRNPRMKTRETEFRLGAKAAVLEVQQLASKVRYLSPGTVVNCADGLTLID